MSSNIVLTFALWFGATIALICAIYICLIARHKNQQLKEGGKENEYI